MSSSISGINFTGISSGLDTSSIIQKLVSLESAPISTYQTQLNNLQNQQSIYSALQTSLLAIGSAASALSAPNAFNAVQATSSDTSVATITGSSSASVGVYSLTVTHLAQAQKIASAAQTDATSTLNQSGTIEINGKAIQVSATDSLTALAQNINAAGAGVVASIINGGTGNAFLTLASSSSGASNAMQLTDLSGSVLNNLGVIGGTAGIRQATSDGAASAIFSSSTETLGQLIPNSGLTTGSFQVDGQTISVDFSSDTLQSLATKLTTAGVPTTVKSVTDSSGNPGFQLDIASQAGGNTFSDPQNILQSLGVLQQAPSSQLVKAQDASYTLDNVSLTSPSNTITSAIPGATLTLLSGTPSSPGTSTLSLSKDTNAIEQNIQSLVTAYNNAIGFINQNSAFDTTSYASGPLFGDPVAEQVVSSMSAMLFTNAPGATGPYNNLASIGLSLDQSGNLQVDQTQLTNAINSSSDSLASLFQTNGSATGAGLSYVTYGNATQSGTYNVNITSLPTFASYTAATAQTTAEANTETLSFSGKLFGSTVNLTIPQGSSQTDIINQINGDSRFSGLLQASADSSGHLVLTSLKSGSAGNFSVISTAAEDAQGDNSGIGTTGTDGTAIKGTDLQGTINGEPATGGANGLLTGNSGNATTDGLQIKYTGTTTGAVGTVTVNKGVATTLNSLINSFTDPVSGLLTTENNSLTAQETDVNNSITQLQQQVADLTTQLQNEFANMETAIAQLQQQGQAISSFFGSSSSSSTSSTSSTAKTS
ncbi:MAG TPA: flagellar filament capping protein FliD [Fimbriimonadaceae bacterium]|nr:flagellar filament capping protein FliD [Fimbriimonadaceae bacterium]